jgi:hypothetical protein
MVFGTGFAHCGAMHGSLSIWQPAGMYGNHRSPSKRRARRKLKPGDIRGLKYFRALAPLLERLHDVATERDRAGNRRLYDDHYCLLILLYLFSPLVTSLRSIQQASELKNVQKKLKLLRVWLGSLSKATEVFDPKRLKEIINEWRAELKPLPRYPQFQDVKHILTAVDGTLIPTLARIAEAASLQSESTGKTKAAWRLHTHYEVERGVPERFTVTGGPRRPARAGGAGQEPLARPLLPHGPRLRQVRPVPRHPRHRQQLLLPRPRQQQLLHPPTAAADCRGDRRRRSSRICSLTWARAARLATGRSIPSAC